MIQSTDSEKKGSVKWTHRLGFTPIVLGLLLCASSTGHAKDPCAGLEGKDLRECNKTGGGGGLSLKDAKVVMTGVDAIDSVFIPVAEMLDSLNQARENLSASNQALDTAIGRENCETSAAAIARFATEEAGALALETAPMEIPLIDPSVIDGLEEKSQTIQDKIVKAGGGSAAAKEKAAKIGEKMGKKIDLIRKVAPKINVPMPKLVASTSVSSRVDDVVNAVNEIMETTVEVVKMCMTLPVRVQSIMMKATLLPAKAPRALKKEKIDKERAGEIMGTIKGNIIALASLPGIALKVMDEVKSFFSLLGGLTGAALPATAAEGKSIQLENGFTYYRYDNDYIGWKDGSKEGCVSPEHSKYATILEEIREAKKLKIATGGDSPEDGSAPPSDEESPVDASSVPAEEEAPAEEPPPPAEDDPDEISH